MKFTVTLTLDTELDHEAFVEDFVRRAIDGYLNQEAGEQVIGVLADRHLEEDFSGAR